MAACWSSASSRAACTTRASHDLVVFVVAGFALAGIAWVISFTTEQVGEHFGPAVTGVLQSTLGNLPEFFVVIFALSKGEIIVAQFSIIGSIFANALLVLGFVIVVGARQSEDGVMRFSARLPNDTTTLLLLSGFIIVLVGISAETHDKASDNIVTISAITAVAVLFVYGLWAFDYLRSETPDGPPAGEEQPAHVDHPARRSAGWGRRSCRSGSSTRCGRRSTSSGSRPSSPAW